MIAAILTNSPSCYTVRQLAEVGVLRGHEIVVVDSRHSFGKLFGHESASECCVDSFARFDAFFTLLDLSELNCGLAVMREFESGGAYSPNTSESVACACNRLQLAQTLAQAAVPMPHTVIAHSTESAAELLGSVGEGPWVLTLLADATTSDRIIVAETREAAILVIGHFVKLDRDFLVQRHIADANREVIRVLVVDNRAVAAVMRRANGIAVLPTSNFPGTPSELDIQERRLAESATSALDLAVADVTLLRSNHDPNVLNVNPFPQLQWWDQHASESTANQFFDLIELHAF